MKLAIPNPNTYNMIFFLIVLGFSLITLRRRSREPDLMDFDQTTQINGLAILLVIIGHFWIYVSDRTPMLLFSGYSVSIFFLLSGFGLTLSTSSKGLGGFFSNRVSRVFIPYWIATTAWMLLDNYLMNIRYDMHNMLLTYVGINLNIVLLHIDFVRWFVTVISIWYIIFYFSFRFLGPRRAIICISSIGILLGFINSYAKITLGHSYDLSDMFSFPVGCVLARYIDGIRPYITIRRLCIILFACIICFIVITTFTRETDHINFQASLSTRIILLFRWCCFNLMPFVFDIMLLSLVAIANKYVSTFLLICGTYSYELYLLHGPLLVKYNPLFQFVNHVNIVLLFMLFILVLFPVCYLMNTVTKQFLWVLRRTRTWIVENS